MRTLHSDIFLAPSSSQDAICVTTNGIVKNNGHAVMGRGIALEADKRFNLSADLGALLRCRGNQVYDMGVRTDAKTGSLMRVFTFPTKRHWMQDSDPQLIERSTRQLVDLVTALGVKTCYLPKPGCSNGHLDWGTQVRPILEPILDNRFVITDFTFPA